MSYGNDNRVKRLFWDFSEMEVSGDLLTDCRLKADSQIDATLFRAYPGNVPFSSPYPAIINALSDDLTIWYIMRSKFRATVPLSAGAKEDYWEKPIKLLEDLQNRKIDIPELSHQDEVISDTSEYPVISDLDDEENWKVSSERLDDVAGEKD